MSTSTVETSDPPQPSTAVSLPETRRLYFIDNLRVFIIMCVLSHHAGNPYASNGFWYYQNDPSQISSTVAQCIMLNPSFTMAILLIFSGYLVPPSFDRRPFWIYVREKFIRLGIPLVIGGMIMLPALQYFSFHKHWGYTGYDSFWQYYWEAWLGFGTMPADWNGPGWPDRNLAHLWYIEHLLVYALAYGIWRKYFAKRGPSIQTPSPPPGNLAIFLFAVFISLSTFAVRIFCPYDRVYALFGVLQIDMSHFPQWLPFFFVGLAAYRYDWLNQLPASTGRLWFRVAICLVLLNFVIRFTPAAWLLLSPEAHSAGFTLPNFAKCVWESFFCVAAAVGLISLFRENLNWSTKAMTLLAGSAYAVHIFHPPMIVAWQYAMDRVPIPTFWKYAIVTLAGIVTCFAVAHYIIRRLPYAKRVL